MLGRIYGTAYTGSSSQKNISAITFAGTVLGQLIFGYTSDKWSRSNSLLLSTVILIVFAALGAGSYGAGGSLQGMFAALTAYRFLVGIGIGGEYPAGSVACSEASGELKSGTRNRWFILFTNVMIDWGFVIGAFVPYLLVVICSEQHLRAAWRISLGLGVVPPLLLLWLRIKLQEPEEFKKYVLLSKKMVIELTRAQGKYETRQDSLLAGYQILLEETSRCVSDLVSLRFQYLQLWHLFLDNSHQRNACRCSSVSVIWLEHGNKPFLCSRCYVRIDLVRCKKHISLFHTPSSHFHCLRMFNAPFSVPVYCTLRNILLIR